MSVRLVRAGHSFADRILLSDADDANGMRFDIGLHSVAVVTRHGQFIELRWRDLPGLQALLERAMRLAPPVPRQTAPLHLPAPFDRPGASRRKT